VIAEALAEAKLVTISGGEGGGAAGATTNNITSVIQTVLAAQLVSRGLGDPSSGPTAAQATLPSSIPAPAKK
jgi:flotillin